MSAPQRSPISIESFAESEFGHEAVKALPPAAFTSLEFYDFEFAAIWMREWICIGRSSDIPNPGDYQTITIGREPLVALRDGLGRIRVLSNVCQHRAMLLLEGRGNVRRIRCPLHSWVYNLDGRLVSAPGLNDDASFSRGDVCLPEIRSEEWEGFLFATFDPNISPIGERLAQLADQLRPYDLLSLKSAAPLSLETFDWNWKLYGDECYHCTYLHSDTWCAVYPTPETAIDEQSKYNDALRGVIAYELIGQHVDASPTRTGRALHPILPGLGERERSRLAYVTVAPNLLIVGMPDKVKYFVWLPNGPSRSSFGVSWLFPEKTLADPEFNSRWNMEVADLRPVWEEDLAAWRAMQEGLQSRFATRGRMSKTETVIVRLNDWLVKRYRTADELARSAAGVA